MSRTYRILLMGMAQGMELRQTAPGWILTKPGWIAAFPGPPSLAHELQQLGYLDAHWQLTDAGRTAATCDPGNDAA